MTLSLRPKSALLIQRVCVHLIWLSALYPLNWFKDTYRHMPFIKKKNIQPLFLYDIAALIGVVPVFSWNTALKKNVNKVRVVLTSSSLIEIMDKRLWQGFTPPREVWMRAEFSKTVSCFSDSIWCVADSLWFFFCSKNSLKISYLVLVKVTWAAVQPLWLTCQCWYMLFNTRLQFNSTRQEVVLWFVVEHGCVVKWGKLKEKWIS